MRDSKLSYLVEPLKELLYSYEYAVRGYRERNNARIAAIVCDGIPPEFIAASGLIPLRVPAFMTNRNCCTCGGTGEGIFSMMYDCVVVCNDCPHAEMYAQSGGKVFRFTMPGGYGENHAAGLKTAVTAFQGFVGLPEGIDEDVLREQTELYNALRRLVRGIFSLRKERPSCFSQADLQVIMDAAVALPPELVIGSLDAISAALRSEPVEKSGMLPAFVYSSFIGPGTLIDELEDAGFNIVEDDACNGRRQFDISVDHESPHLIAELLDVYSYRPLCPAKRSPYERHDLLYRMIKGQGIELVIFIEDWCCMAKLRDIEFLRVRLMRMGVDPIVVRSSDAVQELRNYRERL